MKRDVKPATDEPVRTVIDGDVCVLTISGIIDEHFPGFGNIGTVKSLVIDVSGITRMTSFGVRQWLEAIDDLPKLAGSYLLGCPTFFVDQLNMVLNFGGACQVLTAAAPYACSACGTESTQIIDLLAERGALATGAPERTCAQCGAAMSLDEMPDSYFAFLAKYGATSIDPNVDRVLAGRGMYRSLSGASEKPPRIIKLVQGSVSYFRIVGALGALFRARPILVGAEGEVIIDLAEVQSFDAVGQREWRKLMKSLSTQVTSITLVDVREEFIAFAGDSLTTTKNIVLWSLLAPFRCTECSRSTDESVALAPLGWPPIIDQRVCPSCGGVATCPVPTKVFATLTRVATVAPDASSNVIANRMERLSRAVADANVANASLTGSGAEDRALGKYEVIRKLSSGGMAEVFLAKQIGFGGFERLVAVKRIQSKMLETRQQAVELFLNEAKIAGRLTHPNIVPVLDVGQDAGTLYLAMEYVHGKDLRDLLKTLQGRRLVMELDEALYIAREVATALNFAYWSTDIDGKTLQVVHRDVSPHNVILGYDGAVKLLDFGVAMSSITEEGEQLLVGKWQYMSPEVTRQHKADHRSDLFSLGVLLYLMTVGSHPFTGADPREIIRKIRAGEYARLSVVSPDLPAEVGSLVERLLAPHPEHRPERGSEVIDTINAIAQKYGFELSASRLAEVLETHLPREEIKQFIRISGPDDATRLDHSVTITPSARTMRREVGISESFRRITVETEAQVPGAKRGTGSVPPRAKPPSMAPSIRESMARKAQKPRSMLSIINIVLLVGTFALVAFVAYMLFSSS